MSLSMLVWFGVCIFFTIVMFGVGNRLENPWLECGSLIVALALIIAMLLMGLQGGVKKNAQPQNTTELVQQEMVSERP